MPQGAASAAALGSNLLGAIVGGVLEHVSLSHGIGSLSFFALAIYLLAYLTLIQQRQRQLQPT